MWSSRLSCLLLLCAQAGWDSSVWKYVPHALKGIKPVTNEPWARDAGMNEGLAALALHDQQHGLQFIEGEPEEMESWIA